MPFHPSSARSTSALIGLDWGTTQLRAYLLGRDGAVRDTRTGGPGIMSVAPGGFGAAFRDFVAPWSPGSETVVIASGMVGSRQGWLEVPYLSCPAGLPELAAGLAAADAPGGLTVHLVPGLSVDPAGRAPDVMRGEETQVLGASTADGTALLPGTHSKWVHVEKGRIAGFTTYMTGEVFALLAEHSILARMMDGSEDDEDGFARGVGAGLESGGLLQSLFSARTLALFDRIAARAVHAYLSGLLIGAEIREELGERRAHGAVTVIGGAALAARYRRALAIAGVESTAADADATPRGLVRIARAAGIA